MEKLEWLLFSHFIGLALGIGLGVGQCKHTFM